MVRLTGAQMRYLHAISKAESDGARSVDIARALGVSKVSVSRMVKLLAGLSLVTMQKRGSVTLTPLGETTATAIDERYTKIYPFFTECLELDETEALDNTYALLGALSETCLERLLVKKLQNR